MATMVCHSVIITFWKEIAFHLQTAMDRNKTGVCYDNRDVAADLLCQLYGQEMPSTAKK